MTVFNSALDLIFASDDIAVDATYTPVVGTPSTIRAIIDHDVELVALGESEIADRRHIIGVKKSDIAAPARGDIVAVGSDSYEVDRLFDDDGLEVRVIAKKSSGIPAGAITTEGGQALQTEGGLILEVET